MLNKLVELPLAQYDTIQKYHPRIGDVIIKSGWVSTSYGIISGIDDSKLRVIEAGLPMLLFTMDNDDKLENTKVYRLSKIKKSKGEFAIIQNGVWYV